MTTTDRAFIAALQQSDALTAGVTAPSGEPAIARLDTAHRRFRGSAARSAKAPLSEHLAKRKADALADRPLLPGVEVESLPWPRVVKQLTEAARQPLLNVLSQVSGLIESSEAPLVALRGVRPGVGTTTATLALTRLIADVGGRVALIDATPEHGAAALLGVRRVAQLDHRLDHHPDPLTIDDLLVTSRGCGTSVLAVGAGDSRALAEAALSRLMATHDLVLVDAPEPALWIAAAGAERSATLLIDTSAHDAETRRDAVASAAAIGLPIAGIVETFVGG